EREAAQVPALLAGPLTVRADPGHGAGLGPGALTGGARALAGQPQAHRGPVQRVAERQRGLGLHVRAPPRPGLRGARAAAAEHAAQDVAQAAAALAAAGGRAAAEQVAEVE